jgi:hypothetical protein
MFLSSLLVHHLTPEEQHNTVVKGYREGHLSPWQLWRLLSSTWPLTVQIAARVYETLGFRPFAGYPLVRED